MDTPDKDIHYMELALEEARKGTGRTSPNPCVGAVLVKKDQIVGCGYHKKAGTPHAEVHAIADAGSEAKGATMYVTLEPCNHTGKTPPCSHAVVKSGIRRVVIGMLDPNPLVDGSGRDYLLKHGVEVESGVLEEQCLAINRPFIKYITTGLPHIVMKAGVSMDGRLSYQRGVSGWMTGAETLEYVHHLRNRYDAILVGKNTVIIDNPSLTARLQQDDVRDPVRVVLDSHLEVSPSAKVYNLDSSAPTYVFCRSDAVPARVQRLLEIGVEVMLVSPGDDGHVDLKQVLKKLAELSLLSVLVEGGGAIHGAFLRNKLVDVVTLFYAPIFAGSIGASIIEGLDIDSRDQAIELENVEYIQMGKDLMVSAQLCYPPIV